MNATVTGEKMAEEKSEEEKKQEFREKLRSLSFGTVPGGYKSQTGGK